MSSNGPKVGQKKKFELPHIFAILFAIIIICTILTWIIPAGTFDYVENEDGRNIAVAGTWHPVDDVDPVGPFRMLGLVYEGMIDAADIIFLIFITYASTTFIIKSGAFDGLVGFLLKIFKGNSSVITIPVFLIALGAFGVLPSSVSAYPIMTASFPILKSALKETFILGRYMFSEAGKDDEFSLPSSFEPLYP